MNMHWNINDNIEFRPDEKKLISMNNPDINVTLTTPASRCLLLLLEASPDIVHQQDFFKKVWEEEGMLVPTNTLYQNISIVRRGLRAVGETDRRLIATIPRKGFQIDGSVKIDRKTDTETTLRVMDAEEKQPPEELTRSESGGAVLALPSLTETPKTVVKDKVFRAGWGLPLLIIIISFLAGVFATWFLWHLNDTPAFFNSYTLLETENGCYFHVKDDSHDNRSNYQRYKALIKGSGLNCKNYPHIYMPTSKTFPTLAALICKHKYTTAKAPGCITLYFRGVNSD